ncbi:WD repeat and SOCS box-containing protein 1 isoform X3 [Folsomia candida]|uniref:WD repeat and SOCS box-containing protein 1 isoform X3 n=1 Tax=Folsomia candida TaxID=158441 RepID=UPI000B9088DE|nr:WD repeat and SOCS box-containing protein 1 isoform X3 [Folsomia candida]
MASFLHKSKEQIGAAQKIGELRQNPADDVWKEQVDFKVTRGQCWHVVFAPDESYFAWISAPRKLLLVPWDRERNCIASQLPSTLKESRVDGGIVGGPRLRETITLTCQYPFLCVNFGISNKTVKQPTRTSWTRYDFANVNVVATGHTNGRIRIWNLETGAFLTELISHRAAIRDLAFAPDGSLRLISASLDKTLKGWDLHEDGNMFKTFIAHKEEALWCTWSPNSKLLASTGNEKTVFVWGMDNYKLIRTLEGHSHNVVSCSFSPDGAVLATASWDTQVILWDPYLGVILYTLYHVHPPPSLIYASGANSAWVRGVSYSKNGMNVVTVSDDHLIRFWNLMGDVDPEGIAGEDEDPLSCIYSPSGRCVAVGTDKFKVTFYSAPVEIPRLTHLARMAVRKVVLTQHVDELEIPNSLKSYLKYKVWV